MARWQMAFEAVECQKLELGIEYSRGVFGVYPSSALAQRTSDSNLSPITPTTTTTMINKNSTRTDNSYKNIVEKNQ
jgi:hypothetical protein